ncbi:MAG: T9SS type A sorting domain-containing protein [Bacteroidales bacterium]|nr:T9SS type A sorting domain-containing protein [Bacteroidales bacterium]
MKGLRKIALSWLAVLMSLTVKPALAQVAVQGSVYEQDSVSPIVGATVSFSGIAFSCDTLVYQFVTDTLGCFADSVSEGAYQVCAFAEGYEVECLVDTLFLHDSLTDTPIGFMLHEVYHPVNYVAARQFTNDMVQVSWSMREPLLFEDFETGDFSRFHWDNTMSDFPWTIDSTHAFEGRYCMKSTCEGMGDGLSGIEVFVYVPSAGKMSFYGKVSSESPWDAGYFYLDGMKKMECSGEEDWNLYEFDVTEGEHMFRWTYAKDASTDVGDDCFYVDCIHFWQEDSAKANRSFQYYDLFRRRFDEAPLMLASHLTDTVFMDLNWGSLPWGKYQWGVSCYYEGNRGASDTIWSAYLDREMTTTLEVNVTTNVALPASGAVVTLTSADNFYQAAADANGQLLLGNVYRDAYDVRVHLDGFVDYVSDSTLSVMMPTQIEVELAEAINGMDDFYVSSTGWAMWSLDARRNRDLQYFELKLNGDFVDRVTTDYFQFDVSQLEVGETYRAQVRPVYLSASGDWRTCEWEYHPCAEFSGSVSGLSWAIHNEAVQLSWAYPESEAVMGAMLFRDGVLLAFTEENGFLDATIAMHDDVTYCLRLVYDGPMDGTYHSMSCEECVVASFPAYCDPPMKLEGENFLDDNGDFGALISWGERPEPVQQWLHYDDGSFKRALGGDNEPLIFWSVRFEAEDLAEYVGTSLQKISIYDVGAGEYHLWVYVGGDTAPRTLVRSQNMTLTNAQAWHVENIDPPFAIPEDEPIWIVVGQQGLSRPAAVSADMGNANGRWVSLDGENWTDMHTFNMYYTWMLRAFVSNRSGQSLVLGEDGYVLQNYNLYRSYDNVHYQQVATIPAVEEQLFYQYRDYLMDDEHHEFYYRLTALYLADDGETCESDFATALYNPEQNYVCVDDHWTVDDHQEKDLKVYPNPAKDRLRIESRGMQRYSVYNTMGQRIMSGNVISDGVDIDLPNCVNGMCLLKVETEDAVMVRRFVVSH